MPEFVEEETGRRLYHENETTLDIEKAIAKKFIPKKGEVLCRFAEFWFNKLDVSNHFISRESNTKILVKKMKMIPMECIVRGYFYESLLGRWKDGFIQLP